MQRRKLGRNGLDVPALGLGCMGMSISYGEPNDEESIATMHRARTTIRFRWMRSLPAT